MSQGSDPTKSAELTQLDKYKINQKNKRALSWWLSKTATILGLLYLALIVFLPTDSRFKINKIGNTEIFIFAVILLFNSGLLDKLEDFSIDGTKIQAKFQKLEAEQKEQKQEIDNLQQKQIDLQQKQLEILASQQRKITKLQERQKFALNFVSRSVVDRYEFMHIQNLKNAEENENPYLVSGKYIVSMEQQLRHLYAMGFIGKHSNRSITALVKLLKQDQYRKEDLTKHLYITLEGKKYLELREELGINELEDEEEILNGESTSLVESTLQD